MPKPGGLCNRLFRAIEALLDAGCTVHYVAVRPFPIDHPDCHWHRLWWPESVEPQGGLFWAWLHFAMPWQLLYLGIRRRATHAFSFSINYGALLLPLRLVRRLEYSLFLRADSIANNRIKKRPRGLLVLEWFVEATALWKGKAVFVSESLLKAVMTRHTRISVRAVLVLRNEVKEIPWRSPQYTRGLLELGFVGLLEPRKNPDLALEVVRRLQDWDVRLHFFGVGPEESRLRDASAELGSRVAFHGWASPSSIWPRIHLLLHPSWHEGASNSILEALSAGAMVLASDIREHRECLPATLLAPVNEPDVWARRIRRLIDDRNYREMILKDVREAADPLRFDWEQAVRGCILEHGQGLSAGRVRH